jgi:hypothetical protein
MTYSPCIQFRRPDPGGTGETLTLGEALAQLQEEAEALLDEPALVDAVVLDALMCGLGEPRVSFIPETLEDLEDEEPTDLPLAS